MSERVTNIFSGQVVNIFNSLIVTEVTVSVSVDLKLVSIITSESYESLDLTVGSSVSTIIKPTEVLVGKSEIGTRFSTRNCLLGVVEELRPCDAMIEVIGASHNEIYISALATIESIEELNLKIGENVFSFLKRSV